MAFDQINKYTDSLKNTILKIRERIETEQDPEQRMVMRAEARVYFNCLLEYYESVLQINKFKGQKVYCKKIMEELEPAFCTGYFSPRKPIKA